MKSTRTTNSSSDFESKLKQCDLEIRNFIAALKKENLTLHQKIARLQAEKVSLQSRIKITEEEFSKYRQENPHIEISEQRQKELRKLAASYAVVKIRKNT